MTYLTIVLFLMGIIFLLLGWRWQNPPGNEVIAALKGVAQLKRQTEKLRDDLYALEDKVVNGGKQDWTVIEQKLQELRVEENRVMEELNLARQELKGDLRINDSRSTVGAISGLNWDINSRPNQDPSGKPSSAPQMKLGREQDNDSFLNGLPEKYRRVLELDKSGLPVPEIAKSLGLSRDAVVMVLRTYQRGRASNEN